MAAFQTPAYNDTVNRANCHLKRGKKECGGWWDHSKSWCNGASDNDDVTWISPSACVPWSLGLWTSLTSHRVYSCTLTLWQKATSCATSSPSLTRPTLFLFAYKTPSLLLWWPLASGRYWLVTDNVTSGREPSRVMLRSVGTVQSSLKTHRLIYGFGNRLRYQPRTSQRTKGHQTPSLEVWTKPRRHTESLPWHSSCYWPWWAHDLWGRYTLPTNHWPVAHGGRRGAVGHKRGRYYKLKTDPKLCRQT